MMSNYIPRITGEGGVNVNLILFLSQIPPFEFDKWRDGEIFGHVVKYLQIIFIAQLIYD